MDSTAHERVSRRDQPTSRVGICSMSRSFGTLVQLNTLLQVCTKLCLTRDGRMPDLGSDQGAKYKASELRARRGLGLFTELFTVRYTVVTIGSAPGYGHFGSPSSSTGLEGGGEGCGGVREPRKFSPAKAEVISKPLKDTAVPIRVMPHLRCRLAVNEDLVSTNQSFPVNHGASLPQRTIWPHEASRHG